MVICPTCGDGDSLTVVEMKDQVKLIECNCGWVGEPEELESE